MTHTAEKTRLTVMPMKTSLSLRYGDLATHGYRHS